MPFKALPKLMRRTFILCAALSFSFTAFAATATYQGPSTPFSVLLSENGINAMFRIEIGTGISSVTTNFTYNATGANITKFSYTANLATGYHFSKWEYRESSGLNSSGLYGCNWFTNVGTISTAKATFTTSLSYGARDKVRLVASGAANTYTIKFAANGGEGKMDNQSMTYGKSAALSANAFTKSGYHFVGWLYNSKTYADKQSVSNLTSDNNASITLVAQWEANPTYLVHFNSNSSGSASGDMTDQTYIADISYSLPKNTFVRPGYTFLGWAVGSATGDVKYTDGAEVKNLTTASSVTLYAKWKPKTYVLTFLSEGGSTPNPDKISVTYDSIYANIPETSRVGYRFLGWYTKVAQGDEIKNGDRVKVTSDTEIYAQWSVNQYKIIFDAQGGDGYMSPITVNYNQSLTLPQVKFNRPGYSFAGWTYNDISYANEESIINLTDEHLAEVTLNATWEPLTYNVEFDPGIPGAEIIKESDRIYGEEYQLPSLSAEREHYYLHCWKLGNVEYLVGGTYSNLTTKEGETVTLTAHWMGCEYTLTFDAGEGTLADDEASTKVTYESSYGKFPTPTRVGYHFVGWFAAKDASAEEVKETDICYGDRTLYAHWEANDYTIKFDANSPYAYFYNDMVAVTTKYDKTVLLKPCSFIRPRYKFGGWTLSATDEATYNDRGSVKNLATEGEVTLYATWVPKSDEELGELTTYASISGVEFKNDLKIGETVSKNGAKCIRTTALYGDSLDGLTRTLEVNVRTPGTISFHYLTSRDQGADKIEYTAYGIPLEPTNGEWVYKTITINDDINPAVIGFTIKATGSLYGDPRLYLDNVVWTVKGATLPEAPTPDPDPDPDSLLVKVNVTFDTTIEGLEPSFKMSEVVLGKAYGNLPTCEREGYTLLGWYIGETLIGSSTIVADKTDHTLTAKWEANSYKIKFDANDGTGAMASQSMIYDEAKALKANTFVRKGYAFIGWGLKKDDDKVVYLNKALVQNLTADRDGEITLFAKWKEEEVVPQSTPVILTAATSAEEKWPAWNEVDKGVWQSACVDKADGYIAKLTGSVEGKGTLTFSYKIPNPYIDAISYRLEINGESHPLSAPMVDGKEVSIEIPDGADIVFVVDGSDESVTDEIEALYYAGSLDSYEDDENDLDRLWIEYVKWTTSDDPSSEKTELEQLADELGVSLEGVTDAAAQKAAIRQFIDENLLPMIDMSALCSDKLDEAVAPIKAKYSGIKVTLVPYEGLPTSAKLYQLRITP